MSQSKRNHSSHWFTSQRFFISSSLSFCDNPGGGSWLHIIDGKPKSLHRPENTQSHLPGCPGHLLTTWNVEKGQDVDPECLGLVLWEVSCKKEAKNLCVSSPYPWKCSANANFFPQACLLHSHPETHILPESSLPLSKSSRSSLNYKSRTWLHSPATSRLNQSLQEPSTGLHASANMLLF